MDYRTMPHEQRMKVSDESPPDNRRDLQTYYVRNIDHWLVNFKHCTDHLVALKQSFNTLNITKSIYNLCIKLLKYFPILTSNLIQLLKVFIEYLILQTPIEETNHINTKLQMYLTKIFATLFTHQNFLEQIVENSIKDNRRTLVDIMSFLIQHYNHEYVQIDCEKHFQLFLTIYNGKLSLDDQHILNAMYTYEKYGYTMYDKYKPFIWGEQALKFYTLNRQKKTLWHTPNLATILALLEDNVMLNSILYYPVVRRLRTLEPVVYEHGDIIYDPTFLIPVFYHSLAPECIVQCQQFVEKRCLSYCLMALSTRCALLRAVVYNCLWRFEQHLISQRFYCKDQISTMLLLLKNGVRKSNLKLAPIVSLFLSKLVDLFTKPESKFYRRISRYLLKQSYIDLVHVPLFAELFHSLTMEHKQERSWILNLLKYGIKDPIDYRLCTKSYVFKTLMTFYNCSLSDNATKLEIIEIFHSTSKISESLMSLMYDYGLLLWLQTIIKDCTISKHLAQITLTMLADCLHQLHISSSKVSLTD
ncbi:unnamed protein product, partial [Didymodactylos carnosus]